MVLICSRYYEIKISMNSFKLIIPSIKKQDEIFLTIIYTARNGSTKIKYFKKECKQWQKKNFCRTKKGVACLRPLVLVCNSKFLKVDISFNLICSW